MRGPRSVLVWTVLTLLVCLPVSGATVDSIPRPATGTWSVDTTGTLRPETLAEVNRLGTEVDASGQGQLAVVVVDSTEGVQPRAFATDLFNRWGIGNEAQDDGVLLFVALGDRKLEIVLGDGVDTSEDLERSDALMARLVPLFKSGDLDAMVLEGTRGLSTLLAQSPLHTGTTPAGGERKTATGGDAPWSLFSIGAVLALIWLLSRGSSGSSSGGTFFGGGGSYSGGSFSGGGGFGGGSSSGSGSSGSG
jgi:uncharacterized protein